MSPRAAWRLERLGFEAYDYVAGKADWLAAGLPVVPPRPAPALVRPPTCKPDEADGAPDGTVVVNEHDVVLGRVRDGRVHPAPLTVRADNVPHDHDVIVTAPDGVLLGVLRV